MDEIKNEENAGIIIAAAIIFTNKGGATPIVSNQPYVELAKQVGVDQKTFQACMDSKKFDGVIDQDAINAIETGGKGTPWTLVITKQGSIYPISGAQSYEVVKQVVDLALKDAETGKITLPESMPVDASNDTNSKNSDVLKFRPISASDHVFGNKDAKVTIIEYSDFQCPYCKAFHPTLKRISTEYGDKINWVYRHFPLEAIHPNARPMALASECIAEAKGNEAFWQFADLLFGTR